MEEIHHVACFTGHRPEKCGLRFLPGDAQTQALGRRLDDAVELLCNTKDVRTFLCGMANGFDLFAAQRVFELRSAGRIAPHVEVIAVLPCRNHAKEWKSLYWKEIHAMVLRRARESYIVAEQYQPNCYTRRNAFLVANAQYVLAFWNHNPRSGTGQTVRFANEKDRVLLNLYDL